MSSFDEAGPFPDPKFILQWGIDSQHGLCCGIFGCPNKVAIQCEICGGGYCKEHKDWHKHTENFDGIIIK